METDDPKTTGIRPSFAIKCIELFIRKLDVDGSDIVFQVRDIGCARIRWR